MNLSWVCRGALGATVSCLALLAAFGAQGQTVGSSSLNLYGVTGLIDMPSAETQPDAYLNSSVGYFGPFTRTTLNFQISPRLSGSFRYVASRNWNDAVYSPFDTYYDRSFDLKYKILDEGTYVPAVAVGLQDFIGTGFLAGEYVVATKNILPNVKTTLGLGWGRLGSYGGMGAPFGKRDPIEIGQGGKPNAGQWFRGDVAPFGGIEWQVNDKLAFKAEYSSDDYVEEAQRRKVFERRSPMNYGLEYRLNEWFQLGGYYLYGSEFGLAAHFVLNPKQRPMGGVKDGAPDPVKMRPLRSVDPDAWSPEWVTQDNVAPMLIKNLNMRLKADGLLVEGVGYTGTTARVSVRNMRYDAKAQIVGRVARAMSHAMPASVEIFEIIPVVNGMPASKIVVRRSDLERLEHAPNANEAMRSGVRVANAPPLRYAGLQADAALYPDFRWQLGPYMTLSFFDPKSPIRAEVGARLAATFEMTPGQILSGSVSVPIAGNIAQEGKDAHSKLPHVRTDRFMYNVDENPVLDKLTWAWYARPSDTLFSRVTVGYMERMYGGISGEVLWKQANSPFALGAEVNYVKKRDFDQWFGFQDYDVVTGHVSGYYALPNGYHAQLDVGRYLAGDTGATFALRREFDNGWKVGAFATFTNVSAEDFGEGSFDKGITLTIPFNWALGSPSVRESAALIRPVLRDGGARLSVDGRLYDAIRPYDESGINAQWGRFWK